MEASMRLAEVQFVHWAAIRPDPIPLAFGVNQVLGPNGAGKTAFLDGVKLLYGVDEVGGDHHLRGYVYRGGPELADGEPPVPADQAYLRGTFHNPYWAKHGLTFEDPDGFRVVLVPEHWED
jgi:hypothetical protein